jgi:glycosyltransferase involved in cell wall biosynthesis
VVALAQVIFVHGPAAAAEVAQEFGVDEGRLVRVPHGHWIERYPNEVSRDEARRALGVPDGAFVYAFLGLCKPYKGLEALIDAFVAQREGAFLVLAGRFPSPEYQALIAARVARLDPSRVRFVPDFVPDAEVQRYLVAADALVLPYRQILTSGMAMVGLGFGRPVVAPRLGGLPDVVDEGSGLLYDPTRPDALAAAMDRVRGLRFSEAAIREHARSFRWEDTARALLQVVNG